MPANTNPDEITSTIVKVNHLSPDGVFVGRILNGVDAERPVMGRSHELVPIEGRGWTDCCYAKQSVLDKADAARAELYRSIRGL